MTTNIVFSPRVISALRSLPISERLAVAATLINDLIFNGEEEGDCTVKMAMGPEGSVLYPLLRCSIERDSLRMSS